MDKVMLRRKTSTLPDKLVHDHIKSRQQAETVLNHYAKFNGDGTYLIRETDKIRGFILSVW